MEIRELNTHVRKLQCHKRPIFTITIKHHYSIFFLASYMQLCKLYSSHYRLFSCVIMCVLTYTCKTARAYTQRALMCVYVTNLIKSPLGSVFLPNLTGQQQWKNCWKNEEHDSHIHMPALTDQSASSNNSSNT